MALAIHYAANPRIRIDDDPSLLWSYRFGRCLFGATHGHTMKPEAVAMLLATDRPQDWGETCFRHFFFGHIHHDTGREVGGVRVESFGTIAGKDAFAHGGGWRAGHSLPALTFHQDEGPKGRHYVNFVPRAA
ncbi:hypothetical protein [Methylobacterium nigriterrae]|uniref:hypothetical protein n=1 Tax=Methylobacterium nigriterrae TaxID=3127512 RepID=UPI0030132FBE